MIKEIGKAKIVQSTFTVAICTLFGYCIGFIAQVITAKYFGISRYMDIFIVASSIPIVIYGIISGILINVVVVVFTQHKNKYGLDSSWRFVNNLFNLSVLFLIIVSFLATIFAYPLVRMLAPGFTGENLKLASRLIQVLSVSIVFFGLTAIVSSILYSEGYFAAPTLLNSIIGISTILSIIFLRERYQIFSLAIGTIVGSFIGLLTQIRVLIKNGVRYQLVIDLREPSLKKTILLSLPLLLSAIFFYLNRIVTQIIASTLDEGSITILNYAFNLISIPALFFAGSIAISIFPAITKNVIESGWKEVKLTLQSSIKMASFIIIPITFVIIILRIPLVKILFERGLFDKQATTATASCLLFYAIGLLAYSLDPIISRLFYSLEKMKIRMFLVFTLLLTNFSLSLILARYYSFNGLALANSVSYIIVIIISYCILRRELRNWEDKIIFKSLIKIIIASVFMGIAVFLTSSFLKRNYLPDLFNVSYSILIGVVSYSLLAWLLKIQELNIVYNTAKIYLKQCASLILK